MNFKDRLNVSEESRKPEKTCFHSDSGERPAVGDIVKKHLKNEVMNIMKQQTKHQEQKNGQNRNVWIFQAT